MKTFGKLDSNNLVVDAVVVDESLKNPVKWLTSRLGGNWVALEKPAGIGFTYNEETKKFSPPPEPEENEQETEAS